jgi:hypothetical protein
VQEYSWLGNLGLFDVFIGTREHQVGNPEFPEYRRLFRTSRAWETPSSYPCPTYEWAPQSGNHKQSSESEFSINGQNLRFLCKFVHFTVSGASPDQKIV